MKIRIPINFFFIALLVYALLLYVLILKPIKKERSASISNISASTSTIKEIKITAKQFSFEPNILKLRLNDQVKLKITSLDVTHGFAIPELGIDKMILPGKETTVNFSPSKRGTFTIACSVACGVGHTGMRGTIVIE